MSVYRSTNPAEYDDIDGIVINESAPPSSIQGASANTVLLLGQFASGPETVQEPGSIGEVNELYGKSNTFKGSIALKNKKFGALKILRVCAASGGAKATKTFIKDDTVDVNVIKFDALYKGARGNSITVTIAAGSTSGKKYTITDSHADAVLPVEVYDNLAITAITSSTFANSKMVLCTVLATTDEPDNVAATALAAGADGSIADTDYETALALAEVEGLANVVFLDDYNATRNGYLKTHAANMQDRMCILSDGVTTSAQATAVSDAVTAVGTKRDSDGRLIYAWNPVQTTIGGVSTYTDPAAWLAAIISQIHPSVDPAYAGNTQYLAGVTGLYYNPTRSQFISLKNAGICAFEYDADIGFKVKSGITTQIVDTSKITILRRRMADFLTTSAGRFLKAYQNAVNSKGNRDNVKAAILNFIGQQERDGVLPKDSEVQTGTAKLVDTESLNTDNTIGQGYFYVLWKQRIYSSMRFIVVVAEIGETVSVSEQT